ncbi:MAG: hypothetical protein WCK42_03825 [Myxococcaceae bacterium]
MTQKRQILIQNALTLLCEAQRQAKNLKDDTQEEIKDMMDKIIKYVYTEHGKYMWVNCDTQKIYSDYDEIVITNSDDESSDEEE